MEHPLFSLEILGFFDTKRAYTQIEAGYFMAFYKTPFVRCIEQRYVNGLIFGKERSQNQTKTESIGYAPENGQVFTG